MNSEDDSSKTDQPQEWGKPAKVWEQMYKKGKTIHELFPAKRWKSTVEPISHTVLIEEHEILSIPCSLRVNLLQENRSEIDRVCQNTLNNILEKLEFTFFTENNNIHVSSIIDNQLQFCSLKLYTMFPLNFKEDKFYNQKVFVTEDNIYTTI